MYFADENFEESEIKEVTLRGEGAQDVAECFLQEDDLSIDEDSAYGCPKVRRPITNIPIEGDYERLGYVTYEKSEEEGGYDFSEISLLVPASNIKEVD